MSNVSNVPRPEMIKLETDSKLDQEDPLWPLLDRVSRRLVDTAKADRIAGRKALGERWSLDRDQLTLTPVKSQPVEMSMKDVVAVEVVERNVCVWQRGEELPAARIPVDSANAHLLLLLLQDHVAGLPDEGPAIAGDLGRILFERNSRTATKVITACLALLILLIGVFMTILGMTDRKQKNSETAFIGMGFTAAGLLLGWLTYYLMKWRFRCHQRGVYYRGMWSEKKLLYNDVEEFTYVATRMYHNGAYTGTNFNFNFVSNDCANDIRYSGTIKNADEELDNLRDWVSRMMAARWAERFARGETIVWTPNLTITQEGIEYRPAGWVGRKEKEFLPFSRVAGFSLVEGTFHLFEVDKKKSVMTETVSAKNFFPGYYLLGHISAINQEQATSESES